MHIRHPLLAGLLGSLPLLAHAADPSLAQLQTQVSALQQQLAALQGQLRQLAPPADDNDDTAERQQKLAAMTLKVDKLQEASETGPLANLAITGYLDPLYNFNRNQHSSGFQFLSRTQNYSYATANLGDVYLDIKKSFGSGPMAPYADIALMPNRGSGVSSSWNSTSPNNGIFNSAQLVVPLDQHWQVFAGQIPAFAGYEFTTSNQTLSITHNLLFDFSEPSFFVGAGAQWLSGAWLWKGMLGNEAGRTDAAQVGSQHNNAPAFSWRMDYQRSNNVDIGWSGYFGKSTASNYNGNATAFQNAFYSELDISDTSLNDTSNAQLDFGSAGGSALNGGRAQWWGISLLRHHRFNSQMLGNMGWTLRYDYLNNSKNGGGTPNVSLGSNGNDPLNGLGSDPACVATQGSTACPGANRQELTAALLFFPNEQLQLKLELRHDWSSQNTFSNNDGSTSKHNDVINAQAVYGF